ncbi:chemotaxis protein methyltransferase CheR [Roseomonas rosea]|uniref:protein-glutamate O-methyltransferase n=1 Tax=Muricoccus roseus TaxID=198092 RepID=A0A1M6PF12_9PROT|nr:protein-glutamate O-methyltransferase CheR [Roseomonas rosea]SHK06511.1 chemotaxis protein methyltransferase CheR [Roseomonas rosea]
MKEPAPLSAEDLRRLCDFLYRRTGISYGESKRYYIERRLAQGMERAGVRGFQAYMALLRASPPEAEQLINSFTVNETYFYREEHQLRCLGRSLLPEVVSRRGPGDLVRLWSVPCSTGEEPYSIAIWLLENWAMVDAYNIEIIGSDLDTEVLAAAMQGEYGERALGRLPRDVVERYFEPPCEGKRRIIQDLRESVRFTAANLVDAASMAAQGRFDVVFCRNVLIYFDDESRQSASRNLFEALNPGGFLCLGHSESMARISGRFAVRRFEDAVVYQRPQQPPVAA